MIRIEDLSTEQLESLNHMGAEEMIVWAFGNYGKRAAIGTSLQISGTVITDMASRHFKDFRIFTVDTQRLHPETYEAMEQIEKHYNIKIERFLPDPEELKKMVERFGEYLFFIDKAKQEYCCEIRKVEPNRRALATLDVWITGLRRNQSEYRKKVEKASIIDEAGRKILKLNPLIDWTLQEIWAYIRKRNLPYNKLYDQGYDSIGCIICSTPVLKGEPPRSGRWRWFNILKEDDKKECGIHAE